MSRYTRLGDFVERMPQSFTPVKAYRPLGSLGATQPAGIDDKSKQLAETTQMLKDVQPLIQQLGFLGSALGPMIEGFIQTAGSAAVPLVNAIPLLPDDFKKNFAAMTTKAKADAAKKVVVAPTAAPKNTSITTFNGGVPNSLLIAGGVLIFGAAAFMATRKKKK